MPTTLSVKRVYASPADSDGFRILVDRLWPRGLSKEKARVDLWAKELAPSDDLRRWFAHDPAKWDEFRNRYNAELHANAEALGALKSELAKHARATLLYGARDEQHNHAMVLHGALRRGGNT